MEPNHFFQLALQFVNNTAENIFLTGKAGTGKTTFLKQVKASCNKSMVVVAPTGVAAINANGVTIHSLFQLPFGPIVPVKNFRGTGAVDGNTLLQNLRLSKAKREIINELELLIIDEVSMVRADVIDAIDTVLRSYRRRQHLPFGGVQVLLIGDLFQLPPVVGAEMEILNQFYKSPFFFDAKVFETSPLTYLELNKVYRQQDEDFIQLLNQIRNNTVKPYELEALNKYYNPQFKPSADENIITLTSHNAKADAINKRELDALPGKLYTFEGQIKGDFSDKALPADMTLHLKEGAQVMFIKNDVGDERKYYNGKLATIKSIVGETITVITEGDKLEFEVSKEVWKNIKYNFNSEEDRIEEEEIGEFTQLPLRLAWAITIHKSQGLTFEKAIIDAGDSFASGQVYVALSRLTSPKGLVLFSRIGTQSIDTDKRVLAFSSQHSQDINALKPKLEQSQEAFLRQTLINNFSWEKLVDKLQQHALSFEHKAITNQEVAQKLAVDMINAAQEQLKVSKKFCTQLEQLLPQTNVSGYDYIYQRVEAASKYFITGIENELLNPLLYHFDDMKNRARVKKYLLEVQALITLVSKQLKGVKTSLPIIEGLKNGTNPTTLWEEINKQNQPIEPLIKAEPEVKKEKQARGETQKISLRLFKEGKTIPEIAEERSLTVGTIEGHLGTFIVTGEISVLDIVSQEKMNVILEEIKKIDEEPILSSAIKTVLGDDYSYGEIRAVLAHNEYLKSLSEKNV
ncbi:MAG: hypothetical protein RLZZ175_1287 [Bacteroidota bacterium]|jgi:hypothetical protein